MNYLRSASTPRATPQSEAIPGSTQVENNAGGFAWTLSSMDRLRRFLILGSESGTYYVSEHKLTSKNTASVREALDMFGPQAVAEIVAISESGRASKNDPALYALAIACAHPNLPTKRAALDAIPKVARTGTHLFHFVHFVQEQRGWGRSLRKAVAAWYERNDTDSLAYQMVKYRQRDGWTHRDVLRKAHPEAPSNMHAMIYDWCLDENASEKSPRKERVGAIDPELYPNAIKAFWDAQGAATPFDTAAVITRYGRSVPREALNNEHLNSPDVWRALLEQGMPMGAMIRNLPTMTRHGVLTAMGTETIKVAETLTNEDAIKGAKVHPIAVLAALLTYQGGQSIRGSSTWVPVREIVDALDQAFYHCLVPETRVLTSDLRWTALGDIEVGNELIAVDEHVPGGSGPQRKMQTAIVEDKWESIAPTYSIHFADGREVIATGNHRFLARKRWQTATEWRTVQDMRVGDVIRWITRPWAMATSEDGWMGGLIDGEGCLRSDSAPRLSISQADGAVLTRARSYLSDRGYAFSEYNGDAPSHADRNRPVHSLSLSRADELFRLLGQTGASRWRRSNWWNDRGLPGKSRGASAWETIIAIEPAGERTVIDLQTSRKTFIAEGFVSHNSFRNVPKTNKRHLIALDVSGSMGWGGVSGVPGLSPRVASSAMAMVTARSGDPYQVVAFSDQMRPLTISHSQRLDDVMNATNGLPFGGTDCALPMIYALEKKLEVDAFVIYTDNETWAGSIHPMQALNQYREKMRIAAKLIVVGMTADEFTIADPNDRGALDVCGFDANAPAVMSDFIAGNV